MNNPLNDLHDAEDFFHYYQVPYDNKVVSVSRLHILKRFRQYMEEEQLHKAIPVDPAVWEKQRHLLRQAYDDFVQSTPLKEKVFPVFYQSNAVFIPIDMIKKT
ncbi:nitrogenase-stabilizing/protective protein NifW [Aneurinibacillus terranovensis]|uniref:nitrogenase-stabilizing/protective protein NifW n=1 Tax=Aneurinibacillus terranovensis TaxID=278991 RepID=UPI0003FFC6AC|nr:nitrogenase-stabilizing/protective protein NifW [Aneurinibacillus terranovensis]